MSNSDVEADRWVHKGYELQRAGDADGAQAAYLQALTLRAEHPVALQLLGVLARKQGDVVLAESLMCRSVRAQPAQPHVWNNLGNLVFSLGRHDEALNSFDRALELSPGYADAHYNRARALHRMARLPEAAESLRAALGASVRPTAAMLQLRSQIEADSGALKAALASIDNALQLSPDRPALLHNKATLLQRQHRPAEALVAHERAQALGLDAADAHYNLGNTLQSLGRHREAAEAYGRALAREPLHRLALYDLARLRWRLGGDDFERELLQAEQADLQSAVAVGVRASLLWRAERYIDAHAAFSKARERAPQNAQFLDGQGRCLVRMGDIEAGLAAHTRAAAMAPDDADVHLHSAVSLLIARRPEHAAQAVQRALELRPADIQAWAICGLCWRLLGDDRAGWLNDSARLVSAVDLAPPPGFDSMSAFNAALTRELLPLHGDRRAPVDQTLRQGTQTFGELFEQRHPLVDALKVQLTHAIDGYVAALPQDPAHPVLARRGKSWRFADSWSSRLASGGYHTNHVHPHGWLSSAYYVGVPDGVGQDGSFAGWLQFGEPDFDAGLADPVLLRIEPKPGRLVLFPSLFWHGTAPLSDAEHRLTVAFDVVPR